VVRPEAVTRSLAGGNGTKNTTVLPIVRTSSTAPSTLYRSLMARWARQSRISGPKLRLLSSQL